MFNLEQGRNPLSHPGTLARRVAIGLLRSDRARLLPRLVDVHPGRPTGGRWVGLRTVPTDRIRGTASTAASRGRDFRPLRGHRPADWTFRWTRLLSATDQALLPPVQLLRAGGDYWVVDGHNRVALAKARGQIWIDADITELDLSPDDVASASAKEN
jgi:hypothetical protein